MICQDCNGHGSVDFRVRYDLSSGVARLVDVLCGICHGNGYLPPVIDRLPRDVFQDFGGEG